MLNISGMFVVVFRAWKVIDGEFGLLFTMDTKRRSVVKLHEKKLKKNF